MIRMTLFALSLALPAAALAQVQPGSWELTVVTQMADADKPTGPLQKTQCFSAQDVQDPGRVLGTGGGCQFSNRRTSGDSFAGQLDLGAGSGFRMNTKISGRRLGPC